jgi:type VI secretion system protein ImpB
MADSGQDFVGRNRAPRVQISTGVEGYGAQTVRELPFVMTVMSGLSGKSEVALPPVAQRKFQDIDSNNFESRLKAIKPRVAFQVDNKLTGEGGFLGVDITFTSMDDFSPGAVAEKVPGVKELLEARTQLKHLLAYMDGKTDAEELIAKFLGSDHEFLKALMASHGPAAKPTNQSPTEEG